MNKEKSTSKGTLSDTAKRDDIYSPVLSLTALVLSLGFAAAKSKITGKEPNRTVLCCASCPTIRFQIKSKDLLPFSYWLYL